MSFILLIVLFAILGVGLGLLFNKFVIKDYPEKGRKFKYVITVIVFLLITVALFAVIYGKFIVDAAVEKSLIKLEEDITKKHSKLPLVRNGIDVTAIQKDASTINNTIVALLPSANELGIPSLVYNELLKYVLKELDKKLAVIKVAENKDNPFIENNKLTLKSLINGLKINILKAVKTTVIVLVVIFVILLAIYVLVSLSKASKEKKRVEN